MCLELNIISSLKTGFVFISLASNIFKYIYKNICIFALNL